MTDVIRAMKASPGPCLLIALLFGTALCRSAPATGLRAEQVTAATAAQLQIGGTDAIGGVGDWYLANDIVEIVVDDPSRAHAKQNHGGTIVDAGRIDRRDEDQFARFFTVINLSQQVAPGYDRIRAEVDPAGAWARLVVSSSQGPAIVQRGGLLEREFNPTVPAVASVRRVHIETEYRVLPGEPWVRMATTFRNDGDEPAPLFAYGDVWMRGGRSMRAWVGNTQQPSQARGFHHEGFGGSSLFSGEGGIRPFDHLVVPGMRQYPPISYALFSPERIERGLVHFGVTSQHVSLVNAFVGDPPWDEIGLMRVLEVTQNELGVGESWTYRRNFLITNRPDVASATDVIFPLVGFADGTSGISGTVLPAGEACSIQVNAADTGAPITQIMTQTGGAGAGSYRAVLPPGRYRLTLRAPQQEARIVDVHVESGRFTEVAPQRFREPAWLLFDGAFTDGEPGRIIVQGIDGSADPVFEPELLDFRINGETQESGTETREIHFVGNGSDPRRVAIAPGRYRLTATRGPEYEIEQVDVEIPNLRGAVAVQPFRLSRVAGFEGYASADFHVHAQASDDSGISNRSRLRSFVADGVDVMVSTDHDHLSRFDPVVEELGVGDRIVVIGGVEVTSSAASNDAPYTLGHHNAWPIPYRPLAHRKGAPPSQNRSLAELYAELRHNFGAQVVQLNHPRPHAEGAETPGEFFTHLGIAGEPFDPMLPLTSAPNDLLLAVASDGRTRGIDFDAVELMNGASHFRYRLVRQDWHALLRQGFLRTATANSDTHGPAELAGYPRNYLRADATPESWDASAFHAAIREGRVFGTNGPLIAKFTANGAGMGDLVAAPGGRVKVVFGVVAATWVPVDEVRLLVNGEVERRYSDLSPASGGLSFEGALELEISADAFVTLEVGVPLEVESEAWLAAHPGPYTEAIAPGFLPTAFANPIYLDANGNGRFDPPGLPQPPARPGPALVGVAVISIVWWRWRRRSAASGR